MLSKYLNISLNISLNIRKLANHVLIKICIISCILTISMTTVFGGILFSQNSVNAFTPNQVSISPLTSEGEIIYAPIFLDGRQLFQIAAVRSTNNNPGINSISPLQARVRMYEEKLADILQTGFNTQTLVTTVDKREGQTVILIGDGNKLQKQQPLITVTEVDARIHGLSVTDLANRFSLIIRRSLIRAQLERQPEYLKSKAFTSGLVFLGIIAATWFLSNLYKIFQRKWRSLLAGANAPSLEKSSPQQLRELSNSQTKSTSEEEEKATQVMMTAKKLTWQRKLNFNKIWRLLIIIGIFLVWVIGFAWISGQFPFTRWLEDWLLTKPILLGIILATILAIKIADISVNYLFKEILENYSQTPEYQARTFSRLTTFSNIIQGILCFVIVSIGGIFFLQKLHVPVIPFLAGAGIVGFAISFSSQNLIRDFINGALILWEDQFAIGDVIDVGSTIGLVEDMNLRMTQIRGRGGRLSTVPNSSITTVHNLTKNWSRIDWTIQISPNADIDKALSIIKQVGDQMQQDPEWEDAVIDPTNVLGVNDINNHGIEILLWFKTKPGRQFAVGREFRRRLKYALDKEDIEVASPRQSFRLENSPALNFLNSHPDEN